MISPRTFRADGADARVARRVEAHAPLAERVPGIRRYVQSHIRAERARETIAELWLDDSAGSEAACYAPPMRGLPADGATFIGEIRMFAVEARDVTRARAGTAPFP